MTAYNNTLSQVTLSGPTLFSHIIGQACAMAASGGMSQFNQKYMVLLIITDGRFGVVRLPLSGRSLICVWGVFAQGVINDMDATVEALVAAADLPISVLIVGVGQADFTQMNILDGDEQRLSARGRMASRDIVQFVPLRNFLSQAAGGTVLADVSRALLAEIPGQLLDFMLQHKIMPNPRSAPPPTASGFLPPTVGTYPPPPGPVPAAAVGAPPQASTGGYV
jgi:copine 5/8/9